MSYYEDLSEYSYNRRLLRAGTKTIGWLRLGHEFNVETPTDALLNKLWTYCKISVSQTRGLHSCDLCLSNSFRYPAVERDGEQLLLGSSEIRVFGEGGVIYAAPTLIYHYVDIHHYDPPVEFKQALVNSIGPPDDRYFSELRRLNIEWNPTFLPEPQ